MVDEFLARGRVSAHIRVGTVQGELEVTAVRIPAADGEHAARGHLEEGEPVGIQIRVLVRLGVREHDPVVPPARAEPQAVMAVELVRLQNRLPGLAPRPDFTHRQIASLPLMPAA